MALKIDVKAGNISNLSDARYCAGMGVEMLGFKIDSHSEESVSPELFNAITGWVSGPLIVGEIESRDLPDLNLYNVDCIQVKTADLLPEIKARGLEAILCIDSSDVGSGMLETLMEKHQNDVKYFLIVKEGVQDLSPDDLYNLSKWSEKYPIMLGYGLTRDNLSTLLDSGIRAISIYGSSEIRPGYKSYDEMADILEELED